jgi:predicted dehydrogenase
MKQNILVVGCGSIGERHLRCFLRTGRAVVAACEPKPDLRQKMRQEYRVRAFASLDEALAAERFEGVVICTPAHTHIPIALTALHHSAGLLIEKPLSVDFDRVDELSEAAAESSRFVGVAYVYHFIPAVEQARAFLGQGSLGKPLQVAVVSGQHFPTFRPAYREIYYTRHETGGGAIQDALTHLANAVEWLAGPATRIYCEAAHQALEGVDVEDTVSVAAKHGPVLVTFSLNQFQAPNETSIQVNCEGGSVRIEVHAQRWGVFPRGAACWDYRATPVGHRDDLFAAQSNAFLDGLKGKPTPLCTLNEAIQTLKFNLAALESARTGQPVSIS